MTQRPDSYFRSTDAVLVSSDAVAKQRIDAKAQATASYKAIRAERDVTAEDVAHFAAAAPWVIGYSMRGACWSRTELLAVGTREDRPAAGDRGACQSQRDRSGFYRRPPPPISG